MLVDDRLIYTANDLKVGLFGILPLSDNIQQRLKAKPRYAEASFKETVSGR
nr:Uncharacterised protein [Klebsiella pneumoniae]